MVLNSSCIAIYSLTKDSLISRILEILFSELKKLNKFGETREGLNSYKKIIYDYSSIYRADLIGDIIVSKSIEFR